MSKRSAARSRRRSIDENVTPLINIVFLLLVFFIIAGNIAPPATLAIDLPTSQSQRPTEGNAITIELAADGGMAMDGVDITLDELADGFMGTRTTAITLKADANVPYATLAPVLSALRHAGDLVLSARTMPRP
ncbi:MAG: biopolymer transporter ExbD [Gammaproteobacteria bacterium]|nr:biopolymer transporter ExbD [Gammaproteobacteria bacterium]